MFQTIHDLIFAPVLVFYGVFQQILDFIFSPAPPPPDARPGRKKIAVIGAGLTGVSAAAHCVGHGFDVVIFEAGKDESAIGGIWAKVNNTSGLQINSIMYRFHPSTKWSGSYPKRAEIVDQIKAVWKKYGLPDKTKFNCKVEKVYKDSKGRWIINNESNGRFDGIIAAIGTCGDPKMANLSGQEKFKGHIFHSSQLDGKQDKTKGKDVLIIGGGASAVESLEFVEAAEANHTYILARSEKWIIPRNAIIDALLSMNVFGQETFLSWIPESLLRIFFYRDLKDIAPPAGSGKGVFTETPMVNDRVFELIRSGKARWLRGDTISFTEKGVLFRKRAQGVPKGGPGREVEIKGDVCIMATGFHRPSLGFLPDQFFEEPYHPPNWYLQVFPPWDPTVCANNCTYINAIGTVGNYHIGIYTRFLLMFLVDPLARPSQDRMMTWVQMTQWMKMRSPTGAFEFFTYGELIYWFLFIIVVNPFRWKWALFVLFGIGSSLPLSIVDREDRLRREFEIAHTRPQVNGTKEE